MIDFDWIQKMKMYMVYFIYLAEEGAATMEEFKGA